MGCCSCCLVTTAIIIASSSRFTLSLIGRNASPYVPPTPKRCALVLRGRSLMMGGLSLDATRLHRILPRAPPFSFQLPIWKASWTQYEMQSQSSGLCSHESGCLPKGQAGPSRAVRSHRANRQLSGQCPPPYRGHPLRPRNHPSRGKTPATQRLSS